MHTNAIRTLLALAALAWLLQPREAAADVTVSGTVGEIGTVGYPSNGVTTVVRFKFTDVNQTKTCTGDVNKNTGVGYAWFLGSSTNGGQNYPLDGQFREWYAMLLVSKKGSPLSCTIDNNISCHVTSCTLP